MSIINMVSAIKEIHKEDMLLIKVGTFYHSYGKDAYILSYLFNFKLLKTNDVYDSAFPVTSLSRIQAKLEQNKINYLVLDRRNNYDVDEQSDNKNLNRYSEILKKAKEKINYDLRIERIVEFLKDNRDNKEIILEMEKLMF